LIFSHRSLESLYFNGWTSSAKKRKELKLKNDYRLFDLFFLSLRSYYLVNHTQRSQLFIRGAHFFLFGSLLCIYTFIMCRSASGEGNIIRRRLDAENETNKHPSVWKEKNPLFFSVVFLLRDIIFGVAHRYYYLSCPNPVACCVNCVHGNSTSMLLTTTATLILLLRAPAALLSLRRLLFSLFSFFCFCAFLK
jgi:hypothetical protein